MKEEKLDEWFCSLTVKQKEHIAVKIAMKNGIDIKRVLYPHCYDAWSMVVYEVKQQIHDHCTDKHGMWIQEGGDAPIFSY